MPHLYGSLKERVEMRVPYLNRLINTHFPKELDTQLLEIKCGHGALIYYAKKAVCAVFRLPLVPERGGNEIFAQNFLVVAVKD